MADRQWFIPGGGQIHEEGTEEYFVPGAGQIAEDQAAVGTNRLLLLNPPGLDGGFGTGLSL